jgi:hypothetical protein
MAQDPTADSEGGKDKMAKDGWDPSVSWTERQAAVAVALTMGMCPESIQRLTDELAILNEGEAVVWPKGRPKKAPTT